MYNKGILSRLRSGANQQATRSSSMVLERDPSPTANTNPNPSPNTKTNPSLNPSPSPSPIPSPIPVKHGETQSASSTPRHSPNSQDVERIGGSLHSANNIPISLRRLPLDLNEGSVHSASSTPRQSAPSPLPWNPPGLESKAVINLNGMKLKGRHGPSAEERGMAQVFEVDVTAWISNEGIKDGSELAKAAAKIKSVARGAIETTSYNLVESLASLIAEGVLFECLIVSQIRVRVKKPNVAVTAVLDYLGVEITRRSGKPEYQEEDHLLLEGLVCHGYHGERAEEKIMGQKFRVNLKSWIGLGKAGLSDSPTDTMNYGLLGKVVEDIVMRGPPVSTLYDLCRLIAARTLELDEGLRRTEVTVKKQHADYGVTVSVCPPPRPRASCASLPTL